ncbi:MAG TPA: FAD-binding protein, partial [Anaerolineales bacterium]|nr:FAD-binding protein [Anaerolineales bacterium]
MLSENVIASQINELQEIVRSSPLLLPGGAGSKTALTTTQKGVTLLAMTGLRGLLAYQPEEFTFTALAGTPLAEIERLLAENGQYLPFDPPLVEHGATLGGTVAAGLSGPGRYRYGGVRDFILGVQFIDASGELVRTGGKVVKNAAGFDLPKLMVGSLGGFGALVELAFKVFPLPPAFITLRFEYESLNSALGAVMHLGRQPLEIMALELEPYSAGAALLVRLGGDPQSFAPRLERLRDILGRSSGDQLEGQSEREYWQAGR